MFRKPHLKSIGNKRLGSKVFSNVTGHGWFFGGILASIVISIAPAYAEKSNSASDGERIFQQCRGCHSATASEKKVGPPLKGLFKRRNLLNGTPATEQNIRLRIKNGGDGMPSYEQILSAKELDQVIEYLRKL